MCKVSNRERNYRIAQHQVKNGQIVFLRCRHCRQEMHIKNFKTENWNWNLCLQCRKSRNKLITQRKKRKSDWQRLSTVKVADSKIDEAIEESLKMVEEFLKGSI